MTFNFYPHRAATLLSKQSHSHSIARVTLSFVIMYCVFSFENLYPEAGLLS